MASHQHEGYRTALQVFQTCHAVNRLPERLLKLFPGSRPHLLVKSGYFISITKEVTALDSGVKVLKGEQTAGLAPGEGGGGLFTSLLFSHSPGKDLEVSLLPLK